MIAPIARWSLCEPCVAPPALGFVEPMLRRRLSSLAKMVLDVAHACTQGEQGARIVFASRHGELTRTNTMLENLADGEALSPTAFSMSVLNAGPGLFSILQRNTAPMTAISAGSASFGYGLLEACVQQAENPNRPVLYIYADEPPPEIYGELEPEGSGAHAVGLLLASEAETRISFSIDANDVEPSGEAQSRAFLRCLQQERSEWAEAGKRWRWVRAA